MIIEWYDKKSRIANQRVHARTVLFGKNYFWLTDTDGTWYLLREGEDGNPSFV
jgi:hypothetical protein